MDSSAAVQSGLKNHFIEHKQAYTAAAVTVLALAVIAAVTGILGLLATEGVSLGFLSSLNGMGSIGSISMLGAGGALTLFAATALGLLTTIKKERQTLIEDKAPTPSSGTEGVKSLMIEELTDEDYKILSPFLHCGEYIEFPEREIDDWDDTFTHLVRRKETKELEPFTEYRFRSLNKKGQYSYVRIETLRERKSQFDDRNNYVYSSEALSLMKEGDCYFCRGFRVNNDSNPDPFIGILYLRESDRKELPDGSKSSFKCITHYETLRDDHPDYTSVSLMDLARRINSDQ